MLLWIDLETTGLDPKKDLIMEIGLILMEEEGMVEIDRKSWLTPVVGFDYLYVLEHNPFVLDMHQKNGLLEDFENADLYDGWHFLDDEIVAWIEEMWPGDELPEIHPAGSSVHFDVAFLKEWLPGLASHLHHRHLDVSSIKMLSTLTGEEYDKGIDPHRALADLDEDIKFLRQFMMDVYRG